MNICIINSLFPPYQVGGAETSAALLADALARAGHRVSVITLRPKGGEGLSVLPNGVRVHGLPLDNLYWPYARAAKPAWPLRAAWHLLASYNRRLARRVGAVLDLERPDVVHAKVLTGFSVAVLDEARRRGVRVVQTIQDYSMLCARSTLFRRGKDCQSRCIGCRLLTWPNKAALSKPDVVTYVSGHVKRAHHAHGFGNGAPSESLYYIVEPVGVAAPPVSQGDRGLVFGYIGRVEPEKGIEVVLDATSKLGDADWRLRIAGRGDEAYVSRLKTRYDDPRIDWLGFSPPELFYRSVDVVLVASTWPEPLPRVIIEALSHGKSLICSTAGGIPEVAELAAVVATYPPQDTDALAGLLRAALAAPGRWRNGGPRRPDSLDAFGEEAIVARCMELYRGGEPLR